MKNFRTFQWTLSLLPMLLLAFAVVLTAQTTISTGSIAGTVTDPTGAVVSDAKVVITNTGTGQAVSLSTNASGAYNSGAISPGTYKVEVSAPGFSTLDQNVVVLVGNTSTVNAKLTLGQGTTTVEVQGSSVTVNTEQAQVQGVLNAQQIDNLPVNGRNFLDLAQLEPGVQIQDGQNFDPTKAGYSSISFGGRFGRTARINVDGVDVSDETVGTTTEDIPASAIQEFQLAQSSLDMSTDLTSSGAVNVTTKSGTNALHGQAFGLFRDASVGGASSPGGTNLPFQRSQFGGYLGGPVIKDKLFFFADSERIKQDSFAPVLFTAPFTSFNGGFSVPFRETEVLGRLDYNVGKSGKLFYRYSYFANSLDSDFGLGYSVYDNKDYTRQHVVGYDFVTGNFSHSLRFSYLKFQNQIVDRVKGSSLPLSNLGVTLSSTGTGFYTGPSPLAPQSTPQANTEVKYDGSKLWGSHLLRYGVMWNHIQGGGFANFYGTAPRITWITNATTEAYAAQQGNGGASNPLNYPVHTVLVGNGLGFNTLEPALGFPAGGLGPDNRIGIYFGDVWRFSSNSTITLALRYDRDTGRTDSDLPAIPEVNAVFPGFGDPVRQPNLNFSPQMGFAWDPFNDGKTSVRGGIGLYYENVIYNNVLFDRPYRLKTGAFNQVTTACHDGTPLPVQTNQGPITPGTGVCADASGNITTVGQAIPQVLAFWQQVLAGNPLDLQAPNPNYIGNYLSAGLGIPQGFFAPKYKTPRSIQINIGIQRQLRQGMVLSADYLRNVEEHTLLGIDENHVGDISNFNLANAQAAIAATNAMFHCGDVNCAIQHGAQMTDYADNGLTADSDFGQACIQALGVNCAFPGKNLSQAASIFLEPRGRSIYNALQVKLVQNMKRLNFQFSYSLSRLEASGGAQATGTAGDSDQDFVIGAADYNNPNRYWGPSLLDRTHQFSFGGFGDLPWKFTAGLIAHFYSPLSSAIVVPNLGLGPGEIFRSDFTGDGTTQDPMPGTHMGNFDRGIDAKKLTQVINNYNSKYGNQPTPAGMVLIRQGLMNLSQLQALNGVAPQLSTPPSDEVNFSWLRALDFNVGWKWTIAERFTIEPSVAFFNLLNFGNFNLPPNTMSGLLYGSPGSINGTGKLDNETFRVGNGTGVYALGAARQTEWGLKFSF
jgi:hypothetical protein